jgi:asparagine N-glycosylation enzyme membrane subunit Stt3
MLLVAAALLLGLLSLAWPAQPTVQVLVAVVACLAAVLAALQAGSQGRYVWLAAFVTMAALLNPVVPFALPRAIGLLVLAMSLALVVSWQVIVHRTLPAQSVSQVLHP